MPVRRRSAREDRGQRSREAILDAALELMTQRGYAGTSISQICAASGLPPSSLYWHFRSKEGLFDAVLSREVERFTTPPPGRPGPRASNRDGQLDELLAMMSRLVDEQATRFRFLLAVGPDEDGAADAVRAALRKVRGRLLAWLHEQLTAIFELAGHPDGPRIAAEMAELVLTVANGTEITRWVEDRPVPFPTAQLRHLLPLMAADGRYGRAS
jgi:AcrR family transcriptional regulator